MVCLGPMSNPDPTSIINLETGRIPLKASNMTSDWSLAFRSWPSITPGWRNWFRRVAGSHWVTGSLGSNTTSANVSICLCLRWLGTSWCSYRSFDFLDKASFKIETRIIGGWKGYVTNNMKTGPVSLREHTAFLNMWLEKLIFCGKTVGPTNNTLKMAETLASGNPVPLGKHLLGSVYHLLHQVSAKLRADQPISNLGGVPGGLSSYGWTCICIRPWASNY